MKTTRRGFFGILGAAAAVAALRPMGLPSLPAPAPVREPPKFDPGTVFRSNGNVYRFVRNEGAEALHAGDLVVSEFKPMGVSMAQVAPKEYGWMQVSGHCGTMKVRT